MAAKSLEDTRLALDFVSKKELESLWHGVTPPAPILQLVKAVFAVLGQTCEDWEAVQGSDLAKDMVKLVKRMAAFEPQERPGLAELLKPLLEQEACYPECLVLYSPPCGLFCHWCRALHAQAGGKLTFEPASEETISAARNLAKLYKDACRPRSTSRANTGASNQSDHWNWALKVRSMDSGDVVETLYGASPDWTWRDINRGLQQKVKPEKTMKWQIFYNEQPIDSYATLAQLGIETEPGSSGEVSVAPVRFIDEEKVPSEEEAEAKVEAANEELCAKADITELCALKRPPAIVELICSAVCVLFKAEESWKSAQALMRNQFLCKLQNFDNEKGVSDEVLIQLQWYIDHEQFDPEKVAQCSRACVGLCKWVKATYEKALLHAFHRHNHPEIEEEE